MTTPKLDKLMALSETNGRSQELVWVARVIGSNISSAIGTANSQETVELIGIVGKQILAEIESRMKEHLNKVV